MPPFLTYLWLVTFFDLFEILGDIGKRPFITVSFTSFDAPVRSGENKMVAF